MTELHLEHLSKSFDGVDALRDVTLDVADGEFFTLVGPSGCGKTTTLRAIAGFESPDSGSVRFGDREMAGVPPEDRDAGIVFQNYALFPHMTVGENVAYGLRFRDAPGGRSNDERVAELLELVDLPGFEERDPDELSGGQRQRVALARALAPGPDVLLLDEPMSALDARLRQDLRTQVKRIQSELGITTVYVTHDQEEALAVSDRVAVMNDGRVEQVGAPEAVYREPDTRFVAEFLGENNVFAGEAVADGAAGRGGDAPTGAVRVGPATFHLPVDAPAGSEVVFCVRPEKLVRGPSENGFEATVETVEFLGESFRAHLDWEGRDVTLRTAERPTDERLRVGFAPEDAHVVSGDGREREVLEERER
ncbi:ABC transporter ATP-binding protein [Halorussus limi]|uniref:Molybdate/tungstate import ATP-binding protein WtpC n=1 Tax=Halorussus limi TaxID=2938695 RepID=A0A8U0HYP3_9EURY|nr:ABC transporter ATP-binding protein [Halorussus limi]UPV75969.1 ABC transporter ATP-binding protein [Halorussus limi]